MFILPSHGVVDFTCMAWNSLFKCIKIQRMQVFWREDEPDYLLRVRPSLDIVLNYFDLAR